MHLLTLPRGGRARAHLHEHHETAIYILSGQAEMWYGERLQEYMTANAGDYVYIVAAPLLWQKHTLLSLAQSGRVAQSL
jgi:uncharacterized RmlC-like cupin family protein